MKNAKIQSKGQLSDNFDFLSLNFDFVKGVVDG